MLYKVNFTIDTGVDYRNFDAVLICDGDEEKALKEFKSWFVSETERG